MVKAPQPPSPLPAVARIADLHERLKRLASHKEVGDTMRQILVDCGVEPWPLAWDFCWERWIERHGDDRAREALAIFHEALEERWEKIKAERAAAEQDERECRVVGLPLARVACAAGKRAGPVRVSGAGLQGQVADTAHAFDPQRGAGPCAAKSEA